MAQNNRSNNNNPEDADYILRTARKVRNGVNKRADAYLAGEYDPGKAARKHAIAGATTALVVLSLLTGLAFSSPADIADEQAAANYRPAPIVMDVDDFVNTPVDDDDDDASEEKTAKSGIIARFRQAVLAMPQTIRLLIVTPLWLIGTGLMALISFLWNVIFASPLGAFIASFALGFAVLTGLFTATAKILFPDIPVRKLLSKRNVLALGVTAVLLSVFDAVAPMFWHQYPLAAMGVKILIGGAVIGFLSVKTNQLINKLKPAV